MNTWACIVWCWVWGGKEGEGGEDRDERDRETEEVNLLFLSVELHISTFFPY